MNFPCQWEILLIRLWIQVGFVPGTHCSIGTVNHLSSEDVLLLKDEQDPKCFTRTQEDFTCFFETADNQTYDFLYSFGSKSTEKRCEMSVQRTEEGTFLHICSFLESDVKLFLEIHLEVVELNASTIYKRIVSVEDHVLLDPPFNVSLHQNDHPGQLEVSWRSKISKYLEDGAVYRIRYSSKSLGEKTKEEAREEGDVLDSLIPGEEVEVQVAVKYARDSDAGHWSSWSHPARAVVPQSADHISLMCYTCCLQNITCQWNGSRYGAGQGSKLFYKMSLSEASGWTEWTECLADRDLTDLCRFHGDESKKFRVKLSSTSAQLTRTFYTQEFTLNNSIKTSPPYHLRGALEKDKLCLKWEAPPPFRLDHLQYEVSYQSRGAGAWMTVSLSGPETGTCLDVSTDSQYRVKLRAKPHGSIYSGYWSDWSDVFVGKTPTDRGTLLMLCIPAVMLITSVVLISLFYTYLSKLKQYFWPPVPNLDKVLQGFLTEINGKRWDPPITTKQCPEETTSSVVEIMSEDQVSGLDKPSEASTQLLSPEISFSSREEVSGSPGTEVFADYVTLSKDGVNICPKGNKYVHKQAGEKEGLRVSDELVQTHHSFCSDGSVYIPPYLGIDFHNHSYWALAEAADRLDTKVTAARGRGNLYTNLTCS